MRKILTLVLAISSFLFADVQNVELLANSVNRNQNIVIAKGDVLVFSERYLITADRALYNDATQELELFGDVNVIRGKNNGVKSNYAKFNFKTEAGSFKPFFTYEDKNGVWMECKSASSNGGYYVTQDAIVSSCDVQDPDWKIGFEKGKLNRDNKFLQLSNAIFYVRNVPVFYLPYFAISTNTTRRTGLLVPSVSYSNSNGLYYRQPIYVAEYDRWDLEFDAQIRTKRGVGMFSTFRFVDTPNSKGSISLGVFKDRSSYQNTEDLKNNVHKGISVKYENSEILAKKLGKTLDDGLWLDFTYLNDIDYINLKDDESDSYDSLVTSRLNYFLSGEESYFGMYAKYYIDTEKTNNDDTLHELPTLHYHRFLQELIFPNLLYSFDAKYHRYYRKKGIGANQFEVNLPLTFHANLLDDFLHFNASENIYATYVKYTDSPNNESDTFSKNYHKLSLYTDLAKPYENFYHTMRFGLDYIIPSWDNGKLEEDFITAEIEHERLEASLVQYFYDNSGHKRIKQRIAQPYMFEDDFYKYGDFEHELTYYVNDNIYARNEFSYSHEYDRFSKVQTSLHYDNDDYYFDLIHTYLHDKDEDTNKDEKESFIIADFNANYNRNISYFASWYLNIEDDFDKIWKIGFSMKKKCWNYTLTYKQERKPKLTSAGSDNVKSKGFYIAFEFYPLGGTSYDFTQEESLGE